MISTHLKAYHQGQKNAVSGPTLAFKLGHGNLRELQAAVERERADGHPICSAPGVGYWWPTDLADAEHCIRWFRESAVQDLAKARMIEEALAEEQAVLFEGV